MGFFFHFFTSVTKNLQVADPNSRVHCNVICWHPDVATQMVTASGDDRSPVVQVECAS